MHHLCGAHRRAVGQHRDLRVLVGDHQRAHQAGPANARTLLIDPIDDAPRALNRGRVLDVPPAPPKAVGGNAAARRPPLQIRDEADALARQRPKQGPAVAAPIEDQHDRLITGGDRADLGQELWDPLHQLVIEGPVHEEQDPPARIMHIEISLPRFDQPPFRVPRFRHGAAPAIGTEVAIDVIGPFPDRFERHPARHQRPHQLRRVDTLRQGVHPRPQGLDRGGRVDPEETPEVAAHRGLEPFDRAQPKRKAHGDESHHLRDAERRPADRRAPRLKHRPEAHLRQRHMEQHRPGVARRAVGDLGRRDRRGHRRRVRRGGGRLTVARGQRELRRRRAQQNPATGLKRYGRRGGQRLGDRVIRQPGRPQGAHPGFQLRRHLAGALGAPSSGGQHRRAAGTIAPAQLAHIHRRDTEALRDLLPSHAPRLGELHHHVSARRDVRDAILRNRRGADVYDLILAESAHIERRWQRQQRRRAGGACVHGPAGYHEISHMIKLSYVKDPRLYLAFSHQVTEALLPLKEF